MVTSQPVVQSVSPTQPIVILQNSNQPIVVNLQSGSAKSNHSTGVRLNINKVPQIPPYLSQTNLTNQTNQVNKLQIPTVGIQMKLPQPTQQVKPQIPIDIDSINDDDDDTP